MKRPASAVSGTKPPSKQDPAKDDNKSGKASGRSASSSVSDKDVPTHPSANNSSAVPANGNTFPASAKGTTLFTRSPADIHGSESLAESGPAKSSDLRVSAVRDDFTEVLDVPRSHSSRTVHSPRHDTSKSGDKQQKRTSPAEDLDRLSKRRKGDIEARDLEAEIRFSDKERSLDPRFADKGYPGDFEKSGNDKQSINRAVDKPLDRSKDKGSERYERDYRDRLERSDKSRGDDNFPEKSRDRSIERYGGERSVERVQERITDRSFDKPTEKVKDDRNKDGRSKVSYSDISAEKSHIDERFHHGQSLPPPPPLLPHVVPQSVNAGRRDEDADRRFGTARHSQRLSPRHDEKERRRSEENSLVSQDDTKRRREDDFRDRKREERESLSMKVYISTYIQFL